MPESVVALIVDIVKSRELEDRVGAQRSVRDAFAQASKERPVRRRLWPTVGDEFQAIFFTLNDALLITTLMRLLLPEEVDCRFGLGHGQTADVDELAPGIIQDGSAWWNAREAIEETHRREHANEPYLRSWFVATDAAETGAMSLVNSFLLLRDASISSMKPRDRRMTAGKLLGSSQSELARREKITQSAVSQSLKRSGGAVLLAVLHELTKGKNP